VNSLDVFILAFAAAAAVGGYRLGFVARATSWLGMSVGLFMAARFLPTLVELLAGGGQLQLLLTAAGVLIGGAFLGQALGILVGSRLHLALPTGTARSVDRAGGAAAGVIGVLAAVWLLVPAAADVSGWPAEQTRSSRIARAIDTSLPAPPDALQALRRLIGDDQFPRVFDALRPAPDLGSPPAASGLSEEAAATLAASTVKVEAMACGRVQDGSGAVVGPELVVTNAHVVAGGVGVEVERFPDGTRLEATVVAFDPNRDLALLRVPGIDRPALPVGDGGEGTVGGVFGHPGGGPLEISPFEVGEEVNATGTDIYDAARTERQVFVLSAELRPGDSGAALLDPSGSVVGVAFAIAPDRANVAYALADEELAAVLAGALGGAVPTGPCLR